MKSAQRARTLACSVTIIGGLAGTSIASENMQHVGGFLVDRTEVTIADFSKYVKATGIVTAAERNGGGFVYAGGWQRMPGWSWKTPFGTDSNPLLPAVHVSFAEAAAYCEWAGKRLPTDEEWLQAAYTESRDPPEPPFVTGKSYRYPTGDSPEGANCLDECGETPAIDYSRHLNRGIGPAPVGTTRVGVNGLYDMGANVWEWTETGQPSQKGTRGGSWWYGPTRMASDHAATKPADMAAVYIGFRCVVDAK